MDPLIDLGSHGTCCLEMLMNLAYASPVCIHSVSARSQINTCEWREMGFNWRITLGVTFSILWKREFG